MGKFGDSLSGGTGLRRSKNKDTNLIVSTLAGAASGALKLPEGLFSLGAELVDAGFGTEHAAQIEEMFDADWINLLEDKAQDRWTGTLMQLGVQFGTPIGLVRKTKWFKDTIKKAVDAKKADRYANLKKLGKEYGIYAGVDTFAADAGRLSFMGDPEEKADGREDAFRRLKNRAFLGVEGFGWGMALGQGARGIRKLVDDSTLQADNVWGKVARWFKGSLPAEARDLERQFVDSNVQLLEREMKHLITGVRKEVNRVFPRWMDNIHGKTAKEKNAFERRMNDWLGAKPGSEKNAIMNELKETALRNGHNGDALENSLINLRGSIDDAQKRLIKAKVGPVEGMTQKEIDNLPYRVADKALRKKLIQSVGSHLIRKYEAIEQNLTKTIGFNKYKPTAQQIEKAEVAIIKHLNEAGDDAWKALGESEKRLKAQLYINDLLTGKKGDLSIVKKDLDDGILALRDKEGKNILKGRKNLLEVKELRSVLGEIRDPYANAMNTVITLEKAVRKAEYWDELYKMGRKSKTPWISDTRSLAHNTEIKTGSLKQSKKGKKGKKEGKQIGNVYYESPVLPNHLEGKYANEFVAKGIAKSSKVLKDELGWGWSLYQKFLLGPKAVAQKMKTVYGPTTHVRNYSAGPGFLAMTNNLPNVMNPRRLEQLKEAHKIAFGDVGWAGFSKARPAKQEEIIRDLIKRGLYNTSVRARDTAALVDEFMLGLAKDPGMVGKMMNGRIGKLFRNVDMSATQLYMAEDNIWKQFAYMMEIDKWRKIHPGKTLEEIKNIAAQRVRDTLPNYDKVGPWIQFIRKLPLGNFIAWPAELYRNTFNIMDYAFKDIRIGRQTGNKALIQNGYNAMLMAGGYTAGVNYALVEGAKFVYDVSNEKMQALQRFVPSWSKNDTLVPLGEDKKGQLQYWNLSYQNPYDQVSRVFKSVINAVENGETDDSIAERITTAALGSGQELGKSFYGKSIWWKAVQDIRMGRGRDIETGSLIYREEDPAGEKAWAITQHLFEPFMPGIKNIIRAKKAVLQETGRNYTPYELDNELAGLFGFKILSAQPDIAMQFKTSRYNKNINGARASFSNDIVRKGLTDPIDIVNEYLGAEKSRFHYQQEFYEDIKASQLLGINKKDLRKSLNRVAEKKNMNNLKKGIYSPLKPPAGLSKQLRDISKEQGIINPYPEALREIRRLRNTYRGYSLEESNPFELSIPTGLHKPKVDRSFSEKLFGGGWKTEKDIKTTPPTTPPPIFDPNQNIAGAGAVDQGKTVPNIKPKQDRAALVQRGKQLFQNDAIFNAFGAQGGEVRKHYYSTGGEVKKYDEGGEVLTGPRQEVLYTDFGSKRALEYAQRIGKPKEIKKPIPKEPIYVPEEPMDIPKEPVYAPEEPMDIPEDDLETEKIETKKTLDEDSLLTSVRQKNFSRFKDVVDEKDMSIVLDTMANFIGKVESDNKLKAKNKFTTASGIYQFTNASAITAANRVINTLGRENVPSWVIEISKGKKRVTALNKTQQQVLFEADMFQKKGSDKLLKQIFQGNTAALTDYYYKLHHTKPDDATIRRVERLAKNLNLLEEIKVA